MKFFCFVNFLVLGQVLGLVGESNPQIAREAAPPVQDCRPIPEFEGRPKQIVVGAHVPFVAGYYEHFDFIANLPFNDFKEDPCFLDGVEIIPLVTSAPSFPASGALGAFLEKTLNYNLTLTISAADSTSTRAVALTSPLFDVPQISCCSALPDLSDKKLYPFLSRTVPPSSIQV
jgi:Receptor family ligand binding region